MRKYFYILKIIKKNLKNYGYINLAKLIFFEIILNISNFDFKTNFYDDSKTSSYEDTKIKKKYNTPYSPTPYYFLFYLKKLFNRQNFYNYTFVDFGCGAGRVVNYFEKQFLEIIAIDININFKKFIKNKKKVKFYNMNLRDKNAFKLISRIKNKKIFFFYEPFDINLVKKYVKLLKKKDLVILINYKINSSKFIKIYKIKLRQKKMEVLKKK